MTARVGGIANIFTILFAYIFNKYSTINFKIFAINEFFEIKTEKSALSLVQGDKLAVNFCEKLSMITGLCPNKRLIRFISKGEKKLKVEFDYIKIIKDIKNIQ